jgi:hypothetical protein
MEVEELAELLRETAEHHGRYEASHQPHNWWDWYAAYMEARRGGSDADAAARAADRYMEEVRHVLPL